MTARRATRRWSRYAPVIAAITLAACATEAQPAPTSLVPLIDSDALPIETLAPTTTAASSSEPMSPLLAIDPEAATECGFADRIAAGEVTFVIGDRLYGAAIDGSIVRCLTELSSIQRGPVMWSPTADRALLNAGTVFDVLGTRISGFDVTNTRVKWEHPDGAGLFGPSASNKTLVRRDAIDTTQRTEVTFLSRTVAAASHPGGGVRIAAGELAAGTRGIVAGADGGDQVLLATITNPDLEVLDLATDSSGDAVYVLTTNGAQFRIYILVLADLTLTELTSEQAPILQLTPGATSRSIAWKVGLCNNITEGRVFDERSGTVAAVGIGTPLDGQSVSPLGWLDAGRLVVASRPLGCTGPADVWIWNLLDGSATLLVKAVEFPAVRLAAHPCSK